MKNKALKMLALALVVGLVSCISLSAMADAVVTTTTTYDITETGDADDVTVTTDVSNVATDTQVTYYVEQNGEVVYIDQKAADAQEKVQFNFVAKAEKLFNKVRRTQEDFDKGEEFNEGISATLDMGSSNGKLLNNKFTFVAGNNCLSNGTPSVVSPAAYDKPEGGKRSVSILGQVSGNVTEYGVRMVRTGTEFPAYGCDADGYFAVVINFPEKNDGDSEQIYGDAYAEFANDEYEVYVKGPSVDAE